MKTNVNLPDKLSDLIDLAVDDLEKCERDDRYKVHMGFWHSPPIIDYFGAQTNNKSKCLVCLAGSVMAQTLNEPIDISVYPCNYDTRTESKLIALNAVRNYHLESAHFELSADILPHVEDYYLPDVDDRVSYDTDAEKFKSNMRFIARKLREDWL